jgi:GNAT superfamily N-acetyltransferase
MLSIRPATIEDAPLLNRFIREFAEFQQALDGVRITEADLLRDGFGPQPRFRALIAEWTGLPAGYAFFFPFYSTWAGRPGLFLEDLFVRSQFRGKGIGKALLASVSRIARNEDCYGIRWEVLDWNQPAIGFYQSLGATFLDQQRCVLLSDEPFQQLAEKAL